MFDPFEELNRMHEEMDRVFGSIFGRARPLLGHGKGKELAKYGGFRAPIADIKETETKVIADIELPGADKNDIDLNITENSIEIKAEKKVEKEVKKEGVYSYEKRSSSFYRRLPLPAEVIADKADANYKNGVLHIEIPKVKKEEKKKKIEIK